MTRLRTSLAITVQLIIMGCASANPTPEPPVQAPDPPAPTAACSEAGAPPDAPVYAFYHCQDAADDDPRPVPRDAHAVDPLSRLEAAMIGLVGGPSEAERDAGYTSLFSAKTELAVLGVAIGADGTAIIDFADVRAAMNNASTSEGSRILLEQLNATAFQFDEVNGVEYRIEGSCDAFWEWLQRTCTVVERP